MALTAFNSLLGSEQGRLAPKNTTAPSGDHVFVLGSDTPGYFFELAAGDHAEVVQTVDVTSAAFVRALLRLRVPRSTPAGFSWEASMLVDGVKRASVRVGPGRERFVTDLAANVSKLSGTHEVGIRLELIEA